jgi:hypothetical protein
MMAATAPIEVRAEAIETTARVLREVKSNFLLLVSAIFGSFLLEFPSFS